MTRTGSKVRALRVRCARMVLVTAIVAVMVPLGAPATSAQTLTADTYYVDNTPGVGVDAPGRGSEAEPFATIKYAASVSDAPDTIMVKPGIYGGASGESFPIAFDGQSLKSTAGRGSTTIIGDGAHQLLDFQHWADGDSLEGFTVAGGGIHGATSAVQINLTTATSAATAPRVNSCTFVNNDAHQGGAVRLDSSAGTDFVLSDCVFNNCTGFFGGALHAQAYGDVLITGNTFAGGSASYGGAICLYTSAPGATVIENNMFASNTAAYTGGAIEWDSGSLATLHTLRGNQFGSNTATHGGALYLLGLTLAVDRNEIGSNGANGMGGAAYLENADVLAVSNYLVQNRATVNGAAWTVDPSSSLVEVNDTVVAHTGNLVATHAEAAGVLAVTNCIYWNPGGIDQIDNADVLNYTCSSDDLATFTGNGNAVGGGMVYADPQFDAANLPGLLDTSPCIEAGSPSDYALYDFFGTVRPQDFDGDRVAVSDIGCYEAPGVSLPPLVPVYRFYRPLTGTHFYTADEGEMVNVRNTLGATYTFEGVAYTLDPLRNDVSLYRFFRPSTGTHFYTADAGEMANIRNTLGGIYAFEGVSYNVSSDGGGGTKTAVYRFFKRSSGTHFYTADPAERDNVIAHLSSIYQYEGPAFWVGQ